MKRDLPSLASGRFDLLVVGGGVHGLAIARDAALRGLSVALVERDDFGSANSGNSLKIVHGGLRYLQHADLGRMRTSIRERRHLLAAAPHLVRPLPFLFPTRGLGLRGRPIMAAALALNDLIGWDRQPGSDPEQRLPRGRILSRRACAALIQAPLPDGCTGGALWYDAQMVDSERLMTIMALAAAEAGVALANHAPVRRLLVEDDRVLGAEISDGPDGAMLPVRADLTINAAGADVQEIIALAHAQRGQTRPLSVALNLVLTRALVSSVALGAACPAPDQDPDARVNRGERLLFLTPWRGRTLVGTLHAPWQGPVSGFRATAAMVESFLSELQGACPWAAVTLDDVSLVHAGLLPAEPTQGPQVVLAKHPRLVDHAASDGVAGLLSVTGVKWTTARAVAETTVDLAFRLLGHAPPPCRTFGLALPGGDIPDRRLFREQAARQARDQGLPTVAAARLAERYGTLWPQVAAAGSLQPLSADTEVLEAEILHGLREEMALSLADLVRRRTDLGSAAPPSESALAAAAALAAAERDWTGARIEQEQAAVREIYRLM